MHDHHLASEQRALCLLTSASRRECSVCLRYVLSGCDRSTLRQETLKLRVRRTLERLVFVDRLAGKEFDSDYHRQLPTISRAFDRVLAGLDVVTVTISTLAPCRTYSCSPNSTVDSTVSS